VFVYQTRAAIGRTLQGLAGAGDRIAALQAPFIAYGNWFLRVTQEISRAQETSADELAARVVGPRPLIEGLKKIHVTAMAFDPYVNSEFSPAISLGLLPPIGDGFARFLEAPEIRRQVEERLGDVVELETKAIAELDPTARRYESHPRLPERIAALEALGLPPLPSEDALGITLLDDVPALDAALSKAILREDVAASRKPVPWEDVGRLGYLQHFKESVARYAPCFDHLPIEALAGHASGIAQSILDLQRKESRPGWDGEPDQRQGFAQWLIGAAISVAAAMRGLEPVSVPGRPIVVRGARGELDAFAAVRALVAGEMSDAAWRARCDELGLTGASLG
jgi:hypothetical protein